MQVQAAATVEVAAEDIFLVIAGRCKGLERGWFVVLLSVWMLLATPTITNWLRGFNFFAEQLLTDN